MSLHKTHNVCVAAGLSRVLKQVQHRLDPGTRSYKFRSFIPSATVQPLQSSPSPTNPPPDSAYPPCPWKPTCPNPGKIRHPAAYYFNFHPQPAHILERAIFLARPVCRMGDFLSDSALRGFTEIYRIARRAGFWARKGQYLLAPVVLGLGEQVPLNEVYSVLKVSYLLHGD